MDDIYLAVDDNHDNHHRNHGNRGNHGNHGNHGIVTFPNFGHLSTRLQLGLHGRMPVTKTLPLEWYNTTNIHLCTFTDFESLCEKLSIEIIERQALTHSNKTSLGLRLFPNLLGEIAMYRFCKKQI